MKKNKYIIIIGILLFFVSKITSQIKIDTVHFVDNDCFDYWQKYNVYPNDRLYCSGEIQIKTQIDSSSFKIDYYDKDTTYFVIEIKKENNILFFKNQFSGNIYKLFFNFNTLQGGKIKRNDRKFNLYQVVFLKKIKVRGEYLYKLKYQPIDFSVSSTNYMYFNKNGELVMQYFGYWGQYILRTDYFTNALTYEEYKNL